MILSHPVLLGVYVGDYRVNCILLVYSLLVMDSSYLLSGAQGPCEAGEETRVSCIDFSLCTVS